MKNKKGLSLIEVCIAMCVAGIVAGVGMAQYGKYMGKAETQSLHDSAKLFASAFNSCVSSSGGWFIKAMESDGGMCQNKTNCTADPPHIHYPCKAVEKKAGSSTGAETVVDALKNKLNYTCPPGSTCETAVGDGTTADKKYFCLSIKKQIKGKNHQIVALVDREDPSQYQIYCTGDGDTELTSYEDLTTANCQKEFSTYKAWNAENDGDQCDWPLPSKATPPSE